MKDRLQRLSERALALIAQADSEAALLEIETTVLGRKGELATLMRGIGELPTDERSGFGQAVNAAKSAIAEALEGRRSEFQGARLDAELSDTRFDPTEPAVEPRLGHAHPITRVRREVEQIFLGLGFDVVDGPEVDHLRYLHAWHTEDYPARLAALLRLQALNLPRERLPEGLRSLGRTIKDVRRACGDECADVGGAP